MSDLTLTFGQRSNLTSPINFSYRVSYLRSIHLEFLSSSHKLLRVCFNEKGLIILVVKFASLIVNDNVPGKMTSFDHANVGQDHCRHSRKKVPMDCFYRANHVLVGEISDEI